MTARFLTKLHVEHNGSWTLTAPLVYESDILARTVTVPAGFKTDFASVPRLPFAYMLFGNVAQEEAVIHDYLYGVPQDPPVTRRQADAVFREAMGARDKGWWTRYPMWLGVRLFGGLFYEPRDDNTTEVTP